jgi:hypothetical protein
LIIRYNEARPLAAKPDLGSSAAERLRMPGVLDDSITFACRLEAGRETVHFPAKRFHELCEQGGTRRGTRALSLNRPAVLVLRRFFDAARVASPPRAGSLCGPPGLPRRQGGPRREPTA